MAWKMNIVTHKWFQHKLNYFSLFLIFEILYTTCAQILMIIIKLKIEIFEYQV